jgi:alkaline phosphatase
MREAAHAGHPTGVVNDGDLAEPGTGAFLAEADDRTQTDTIALQILLGRPDHEDPPPWVVLGGGEAFLLPEGSPVCAEDITVDCAVHVDPLTGGGPARKDGRNLIKEAGAAGWQVVRTRSEFEALRQALEERPDYVPRVLGAFARDDLFNDAPEEVLIERGLTDPGREPDDPRGRLIVWGGPPGTPGFDPPSAAEMSDLALTVLARQSARAGKPFLLVVEVESGDNLANVNNAIGTLRALKRADEVIERARRFQDQAPRTLILTAADSDAGGLELLAPPALQADKRVTVTDVNPTGRVADGVQIPVDGVEGRATAPFVAAPDARGIRFPFAVAWTGQPDFAGGILARAQGANAEALSGRFRGSLDNTDVYRLMYATLFGRWPEGEEGLMQR